MSLNHHALTQSFNTIQKKPIQWLWHPRIPRGKLTLLASDPAQGKTTLLLHLAAAISRNDPPSPGTAVPAPTLSQPEISHRAQPHDQPSPCHPVTKSPCHAVATLLLNPDDNAEDTLRPKLDLLHADLSQIHTLQNLHSLLPHPKLPPDDPSQPLNRLETAIQSIPNLALLIIDPITHYLGLTDRRLPDADPENPARTILAALAQLAKKHHLAIVLTTRLTKQFDISRGPSPAALHRTLGNLAYSNSIRSVLLILPSHTLNLNPNLNLNLNPTTSPNPSPCHESPTHLLLTLKSPIGAPTPALPFTLAETLTFRPELDLPTLHHKTRHPGPPDSATLAAAKWLADELADGPLEADTLKEDARTCGIARRTLDRAKEIARIQAVKQGWSHKWFWTLEGDTRPLPENQMSKEMAIALRKMFHS